MTGPYWLRLNPDGSTAVLGRHAAVLFTYPLNQYALAEEHVRKLQRKHIRAMKAVTKAAPELYDALKGLEPFLDAIVCYPNRLAVNARNALAKAEGITK